LVEVVSGLFPDWMVDSVANRLSEYPVRWTNSPYACYDNARFFGTMIVQTSLCWLRERVVYRIF